MSTETNTEEVEAISLREFLEGTPVAEYRYVKGNSRYSNGAYHFVMPEVSLYCSSELCQGHRLHQPMNDDLTISSDVILIARYKCKNCGGLTKIYSLMSGQFFGQQEGFSLRKIGEFPPFGLYVPPRTLRLIQPDVELFRKGLRVESQGFGIGAFAYYRQIVEGQREHLLKEIKKVAARLGAPDEVLKEYDLAISQFQFAKSIEQIKHGIPQSLLINGHNPLLLLHNALSQGIHAGTDEECLEIAASIRLVLSELAKRIDQALKDEKELTQAVNRLTQKKTAPAEGAA